MVFDICYGFLLQVKVAIIGVEAGGVGLNFSAAKNVVFVELPKTPSLLLQVFPVLFFFFFWVLLTSCFRCEDYSTKCGKATKCIIN